MVLRQYGAANGRIPVLNSVIVENDYFGLRVVGKVRRVQARRQVQLKRRRFFCVATRETRRNLDVFQPLTCTERSNDATESIGKLQI